MIHLALFMYLLHFVSSQSIVEISPLITKNVTETAELFCKVKDLHDSTISWGRQRTDETITMSVNGLKAVIDERVTVRFENNSLFATSILSISNLQHKDAGVYRCSVPSTDEVVKKDVTLQVRSPPFIVGNTSDKVITSLNGSVTLECYGGGYPTPEVNWTRENNGVLPNGATLYRGNILKINNVQREHAGAYLCTVGNGVGTSSKKIFNLEVEYAPIVKSRQGRVGQAIGFAAYLECSVEGSPTPVITWLRDNIPLTDNQFYTQSKAAIHEPLTSATLKIKVDEKRLYGLYTCVAVNKLGKSSTDIVLFHTDKEVCAQNCEVSSGHSIISMLDLKLSFTSVIILMFHWQNM